MQKIPTLFVRDENDRAHLTREVSPDCDWVIAGAGVATRKYDGTCIFIYDGTIWSRREVKPGRQEPAGFMSIDYDPVTGKTVGWEPAEQSSFAKILAEFPLGEYDNGTYELIGPKINGNPERWTTHALIKHGGWWLAGVPRDYDGLREWLAGTEFEGIVWHHPDGRMAKIKRKDFQ